LDLVDGSRPPKPDEWEDIIWYPGLAAFERRKQDYLHRHPHIQARIGLFLPDDYDPEYLDNDLASNGCLTRAVER
jgi:hypothetical protein